MPCYCLRELVCFNCNKTFTMMYGDIIGFELCDDCLRILLKSSVSEGVNVEDEIKKRRRDRVIYGIFTKLYLTKDANTRSINTIFKRILKWCRFE
jgi:hypothetical protein